MYCEGDKRADAAVEASCILARWPQVVDLGGADRVVELGLLDGGGEVVVDLGAAGP